MADRRRLVAVGDRVVVHVDLDQPVRRSLDEDLSICVGLTRASVPGPPEPIARAQFDGCVESLSRWALEAAALPELAGQRFGPFEPDNLLREARGGGSTTGWVTSRRPGM